MAPSMPVRCTLLVIAILFAGIFAGCLSVRKRFAARAERSGGDYRAERRSLASIAFAEHLSHPHTNTGNNAARSGFCTGGWLSAVSVLGVAAIRRNLKNRRNAPPISVRCTLPVSQRTPCSESRAFGWQLPSRTPKPCKVRSCRTLIPFPYKYRKQRYLFRFLHRRTAVCCICSGSCCNRARFEKQKECTAYFSTVHFTCYCNYFYWHIYRLLASQRTPCSESRAFGWQLPSRTPKPCKVRSCRTLIPFPHNTRNNAACSGFCIRGQLLAVSVLGTTAIRQNLNMLAGNLPTAESTLHMYDKSGSIRPDR